MKKYLAIIFMCVFAFIFAAMLIHKSIIRKNQYEFDREAERNLNLSRIILNKRKKELSLNKKLFELRMETRIYIEAVIIMRANNNDIPEK